MITAPSIASRPSSRAGSSNRIISPQIVACAAAVMLAAPLLVDPASAQTGPQTAPQSARPGGGATSGPSTQPGTGSKPGASAAKSAAATGPVGVWIDDTGKGAVEIKPCGANPASLCGNIVSLTQPLGANGQPQTDGYNPDKSKRNRPVCGLQVIGEVKDQRDGTWDEGWIYDPKVGKSYDVAITLEAKDRLKITGYKGVKFLSKSFVWTRAPADLVRCDTAAGTSASTGGSSGASNPSANPSGAAVATKPPPPAAARASGATTPPPAPRP